MTEAKRLNHIAIIMDGNGRWANQQQKTRTDGHRHAVSAVRDVVTFCAKQGLSALTLFAFSSENWQRSEDEVADLMHLLISSVRTEEKTLLDNGVKFNVIGDRTALNTELCKAIEQLEHLTSSNKGLCLTLAINYGGKWDIVQAANRAIASGVSKLSELNIAEQLSTAHLPELDLLIRTGGDCRVSNFLLWQLAYSELYFVDKYFPDFTGDDMEIAFEAYFSRERRYGKATDHYGGHKGCTQHG